jgi:2-keto-4-pentenoate hydratase/2-oxohepta-3-ene-1,7-dioic acid hydratase in catechol pathway
MAGSIKDQVAIAGVGCTKFGDNFDQSFEDLLVEAGFAAFADARIEPERVEAAWLGTFSPYAGNGKASVSLADALRLYGRPITRVENYCATGTDSFRNAAMAVASGMYDLALVAGVEKLKDRPMRWRPFPVPDDRRGPGGGRDRDGGRVSATPDARRRRRSLLLLEVPAGPRFARRREATASPIATITHMRLVTFQRDAHPEPGAIVGDDIVSLRGAGFPDLLSVIAGGADAFDRVQRWLYDPPWSQLIKTADAKLRAPLQRPPKIICIGLNYREHARETKMEIPQVPTMFAKFATSVIGCGEPIVLPRNSTKPDYEAELAFVIGRHGRHIPAEKWQDYVFGYTNFNDVSARDFQMRTSQWMIGKTFDTFAPMGPAIVTADEVPDPHALDIGATINGEVLQHSNTNDLIFKIPELIAYLSSVFTLEPGDIVATGTPSGVGFARTPPRWLAPGDEVVVRVEGLGDLRNPVVAEAAEE